MKIALARDLLKVFLIMSKKIYLQRDYVLR